MENFLPSEISVYFHSFFHYKPKVRHFSHTKRQQSSFLLVLKGSIEYTYEGGSFTAIEGSCVYLPLNGAYTFRFTSEDPECLQVEFNYIRFGEKIAFSSQPLLSDIRYRDTIASIFSKFGHDSYEDIGSRDFFTSGLILQLTACFMNASPSESDSRTHSRIYPALQYLNSHYIEPCSIQYLADLCYLSPSQLTRLFEKETGSSPHVYKNGLLLSEVCSRLRSSYGSISEISESLGFSSIYSFCRFVKKQLGMSPKEYIRSMQKLQKEV